jgi:hypothetical protein
MSFHFFFAKSFFHSLTFIFFVISFLSFCQLLILEPLNHSHFWKLLLVCSTNICIFNYLLLCIIFNISSFFLAFYVFCFCVHVFVSWNIFCLQDYNEYIVCCDYQIFGSVFVSKYLSYLVLQWVFYLLWLQDFQCFSFLFYEYKMMMMMMMIFF